MRKLIKGVLHTGVGSAMLAIPWYASAYNFQIGELDVQLDTTVSAGAIWRMQDPSAQLIGITNGGTSRSVNDDDGNLRYEKGDVVSAVAKATQDLELKWRDFGVFARYSYFYDFEISNDDRTGPQALGPQANDRLKSDSQLLDLFAYGRFDLGGRALNVRIGKQVVSWGESTFIQNGLNVINPIDVSRLRAPGAELKEALLPITALTLSTSITDNLSVEALWMLNFDEIEIDPRRSYFSTSDVASDDSTKAFTGFGRRFDDNQPPTGIGTSGEAQLWVDRDPDREVEDEKQQYGIALRYFAENLNYTEFGLYYLRYHSRVPLVSGIRGGAAGIPGSTSGASAYAPPPAPAGFTLNGDTRYFVEYPEGINTYGLSFNTSVPFGVALQGEYTYRPNLPVQIAATEVLLAVLGNPNYGGYGVLPVGAGYTRGWDAVNAHQVQFTGTKAFGPMFGAQQFVLLGEAGYNHLDLEDGKAYAGPGTPLPSCQNIAPVLTAASGGACHDEGYATRGSWGYRAVTRLDYENLLGPVGVSPRLAWVHDVNGVGPNFTEGNKAIGVGIGFNYLQRWQADIAYTVFTGGRTFSGTDTTAPGTVLGPGTQVPGAASQDPSYAISANPNKDRDFLAVNISYAF